MAACEPCEATLARRVPCCGFDMIEDNDGVDVEAEAEAVAPWFNALSHYQFAVFAEFTVFAAFAYSAV